MGQIWESESGPYHTTKKQGAAEWIGAIVLLLVVGAIMNWLNRLIWPV